MTPRPALAASLWPSSLTSSEDNDSGYHRPIGAATFRSGAAGEGDAGLAAEIAPGLGRREPAGAGDEGADRLRLIEAMLEREEAGRLEVVGGRGDQAPQEIEAVGATVEGAARLASHLRREPRDVAGPDVGRIRHHQIEALA